MFSPALLECRGLRPSDIVESAELRGSFSELGSLLVRALFIRVPYYIGALKGALI